MRKNIEWLKGRFRGRKLFKPQNNKEIGYNMAIDEFSEYVDQLDEPKTLTPEWIDDHTFGDWNEYVYTEDLQNQLVPKQEEVEEGRVRLIVGFDGGTESYYASDIGDALDFLTDYDARFTVSKDPVIPKFVAKWISEHHEKFDLYPALRRLEEGSTRDYDTYKWYRANTLKFVVAYLTGVYEVEKEQKYYVVNKNGSLILERNTDTEYDDTIAYAVSGRLMESVVACDEEHLYQFTEQEIKDYDPRYWAFAKPVEELEE